MTDDIAAKLAFRGFMDRQDEIAIPLTNIEIAAKLVLHEAVCAQRYGGIIERLGNIEKLLWRAVVSFIGGLLVVTGWLIVHYVLVK